MKTEPTKRKRGRPAGSLSSSTVRQMAVRLLEDAIVDESLPKQLRAEAALALLTGGNK